MSLIRRSRRRSSRRPSRRPSRHSRRPSRRHSSRSRPKTVRKGGSLWSQWGQSGEEVLHGAAQWWHALRAEPAGVNPAPFRDQLTR
jgi:hypothetical protein